MITAAPFVKRVVRDVVGSHRPRQSDEAHLRAAVAWLEEAADASPDGGVSYGYSIRGGWRPSYRETSGYIAVTFFDLAQRDYGPEFSALGERVSRWLCEIQEPDGSIANPHFRAGHGIVFDTGQVLLGYVRAYRETKDERFLEAATRAGDWLVDRMDDDGAWRTNTHLEIPHTYNTRVAWSLLELDAIADGEGFASAARKNLDWAKKQQTNALFRQCAFEPNVAPFTHTIAYAIRGFLEAGRLLDDDDYRKVATRAADVMLRHVRADGWIPGQVDESGAARAKYCCLTGNCQLAIIWLNLHKTTGDARYLRAATSSLSYVMDHQDLETRDVAVCGAIKGSQPVWGRYAPLSYPNWATKFFVDAMLLLHEVNS